MPTELYLGRYSWVAVGPPFSFYEVISLRSVAEGVQIERIKLTPPSDACYTSSSVSSSSADVKESMAQLLAGMNPCSIPEGEIRDQVQCKDCKDFSGKTVLMRASCGGQTRLIRMQDTLDKYVLDPHRESHESTFWTRDFMNRLDRALAGHDIIDKPILQTNPPPATVTPIRTAELLEGIEAGDFDSLFLRGERKVSAIALRAKTSPIPPVSIVGNLAPAPSNMTLPYYPSVARAAGVGGMVKAVFTVSPEGTVSELKITDGYPMLRGSIEGALKLWRFGKEASGKTVEVQFEFKLDCAGP